MEPVVLGPNPPDQRERRPCGFNYPSTAGSRYANGRCLLESAGSAT